MNISTILIPAARTAVAVALTCGIHKSYLRAEPVTPRLSRSFGDSA